MKHLCPAPCRPQSGGYRFATELGRHYNRFRYDEGTAQAQGLADDRYRHSDDPVHLLLRQDTGLRRDGARRRCRDLRPQAYPT